MPNCIFHEWLNQHARHDGVQSFSRDCQVDLKTISQPGLFYSEVSLGGYHLFGERDLKWQLPVKASTQKVCDLRQHSSSAYNITFDSKC